jgi:hypothetical protein
MMQQGKTLKEKPASNTNKFGNPSSLLTLVAGMVLIALSVFAGIQVIGVLYGIIFPAEPPLPQSITQLEHSSEAYGVDEWVYSTPIDACEIVRFYDSWGRCVFAPGMCRGRFKQDEIIITQGDNVAQCTGEINFSIFAMRWRSIIATGYKNGDATRFRLSREVFWTGGGS